MNTKSFLHILDISIKRNGPDKVLTLSHLRNLCALAEKAEKGERDGIENMLGELEDEFFNDINDHSWYI